MKPDFFNILNILILFDASVPLCISEKKKLSNADYRIVGGHIAVAGQFPYQVVLKAMPNSRTFFCSGSLISDNIVLTASHCIDTRSNLIVLLGAYYLDRPEDSQVNIEVHKKNFIIHEDWDRNSKMNDIALIKLPKPVKLNQYIQTIAISAKTTFFENEKVIMSGWGATDDEGVTYSMILRYVVASVLTNNQCGKVMNYLISSQQLCTSGERNIGSCVGDSGGPLVLNNEQIGIVSYGSRQCARGSATVFTRLSKYKDWIQNHL